MRRLGQHFLQDQAILSEIARAVPYKPGEAIIEIGPGHGELTRELRKRFGKTTIISLEKDEVLAEQLQHSFASDDRWSLVTGDALEELAMAAKQIRTPFHIVGNIPYYITGHLFRTIGELPILPKSVLVLIQKEVAERIAAKPPRMNRLAASIQPWATPKVLFSVGRAAFRPAPKVESAVISLSVGGLTDIKKREAYYKILAPLFAHPRKTILNNLRSIEEDKGLLEKKLAKLDIDPKRRPESLEIKEILKLAKVFV